MSLFEDAWPRVAGAVMLIVASVWAWRRHIEVGVEGEPPSFAITGRAALVVAIITAALAIVVLIWPRLFVS